MKELKSNGRNKCMILIIQISGSPRSGNVWNPRNDNFNSGGRDYRYPNQKSGNFKPGRGGFQNPNKNSRGQFHNNNFGGNQNNTNAKGPQFQNKQKPQNKNWWRGKLNPVTEQEVRSIRFVLKSDDQFPLGGRLRHFTSFWRHLTSNPEIILMILGARIPFNAIPVQRVKPNPCVFDADELIEVRRMVNELLDSEVIVPVVPSEDQFVSQLFLVTNKDLSRRAILNVKSLNKKFLEKRHFKMETLQTILPLIRRFDYFASWDVRKGYFNIALHPAVQKFFCFDFEGRHYQFKSLVMGLSVAPFSFSKLMSVLVSLARSWDIRVSVYLDDLLTRGPSFEETLRDHECFGTLLQLAGFLLHRVKSVAIPVQRIEQLILALLSTLDRWNWKCPRKKSKTFESV